MLNERIVQWIVYLNKLEQETVYQLAFESRKKTKQTSYDEYESKALGHRKRMRLKRNKSTL